MYLLLTFFSLLLFLSAEKSFVHFSRTARRVFWYLLSCALGLSLVRTLQTIELEGLGMVWVFLSAVLAASVVEDEVRKKLGLTTLDIGASRRLLAAYHSPEAQGKAERLMDIVSAINKGQGYTAGTKQLLLRMSGARRRLQRALHVALEGMDVQELNYVLCAINAPALLEIASRQTLDMLTGPRLPDLTTVGRAVLVDALQKLGLRYRPQRQRWARAVLLHTHGAELTHLKAYLDDGGDYHTMYKLAYHDLQGQVQAEVLEHLATEGRAVMAEFELQYQQSAGAGEAAAAAPPPGAVLKVLSDIDDTLFSSGGAFPAGSDTRYPRKCFYPGALALYAELDRCFARRHTSVLATVRAGVPPMTPRRQLSKSSPSKPPLAYHPPTGRAASTEPSAISALSSRLPSGEAATGGEAAGGPEATPEREQLLRQRRPQQRQGADGGEQAGHSAPPSPFQLAPLPVRPTAAAAVPAPGSSPPEWELGRGDGGESWGLGRRHTERLSTLTRRVNAEESVRGLHQEGSNLVFLSARPESYKGLTESEAYKKYFQPMLARGQLDTSPTMLLGSLDAGPRALAKWLLGWRPPEANPATATSALYQTLAAKKLSRAREYAALYPEAAFVFVGDNGQGDVLCAEVLWSSMKAGASGGGGGGGAAGGPSRLLACLMHRVVPLGATYSMLRSAKGDKALWEAAWRERGIYFSATHVGMATQALSLGLIDAEALCRVAAAAASDFRRIRARYGGRRSGRRLGEALAQLNEDIAAANARLPEHLQVVPVPPQAEQPLPQGGGGAATPGRHPLLRRPLSPARSDAWSDISGATSMA